MARSERGRELEFYIENASTNYGGEFPELKTEGNTLVGLIDEFSERIVALTNSRFFTATGIQNEAAGVGAPLIKEAQRLERLAATVEEKYAADFETEWARLGAAPKDVLDFLVLDRIATRLRREDPLNRQQIILAAASRVTRDDATLRAALTDPNPPVFFGDVGEVKNYWSPLLTPELTAAVQKEIRARIGPFGSDQWFISEMRHLAQWARSTVATGSTVGTEPGIGSIEDMARTGRNA
jgi:hypothetical protein